MTSLAAHIPVLETERLRLRAPRRTDFDAYADILGSDRARYMSAPSDRKGAWSAFESDLASWLLDDFGYWTMALRQDDAPAGFIGIAKPDRFPETELGWFVTAASEGGGYAFEAARAALVWAFHKRGLPTLVSYVDEENTRSIRLAERLGATPDPAARKMDPEDIVFRHAAPEVLQ